MTGEQLSTPIFSGECCHSLDGKNRVTIPSRWRQGDADEFYLMIDRTNTFLRAMPPAEFRAVASKIENDPAVTPKDRAVFLRHFYSRSAQVVADKQGRLVLPEAACEKLGLKGEIMLVGAHRTFEFWNKEKWAATQQTEEATFDRVAELAGL